MATQVLSGRERIWRAITLAVVPEAASLTEADWKEAMATVEIALADRTPTMKRQLQVFLTLLERGALLRYGRPLSALPTSSAERYLRFFEQSRLPLLRRGFWGVRTLALMGYYARPAGGAGVGYRATARGWAART